MVWLARSLALWACSAAAVLGECPNACSSHGRCTSYDMCICDRNWRANDCSERLCMFGLAHVDSPKGDLDSSGGISGPGELVVENSATWPYGTTEQFPAMRDSDLNLLSQSAHDYAECSNKGICDRSSGLCECFDGYDGVACQRASCPGWPDVCSGHGVCRSAAQLADEYFGNTYKTWDRDSTMGCKCDAGYHGPDCSARQCKYGVDPLYLDDSSTIKYSTFDLATLTTAPGRAVSLDTADGAAKYYTNDGVLFNDGTADPKPGSGKWSIRFFDSTGEDWVTDPIAAGASCADVVAALEALPNDVVPHGYTQCTRSWNAAMTPDNQWGSTGASGVAVDFVATTTRDSAVLNVASTTSGALSAGMYLRGDGIPPGTFVTDVSGLTSGVGTVTLNHPVTVPSLFSRASSTVVVGYNVPSYEGSNFFPVSFLGSVASGSTKLLIHSIPAAGIVALHMELVANGVPPGTTITGYGQAVGVLTLTLASSSDNVAALMVVSGSCATSGVLVGSSVTVTGVPSNPAVYITYIESLSAYDIIHVSNLVTATTGGTITIAAAAAGTSAGAAGVYIISTPATSDVSHVVFDAADSNHPAPIYQTGHPATSKHPYKINYRLAIWDAYAPNDKEDIGEGGLYTPLIWYPGSFPKGYSAPPASSRVHKRLNANATLATVTVEQAGSTRLYTTSAYDGTNLGTRNWITVASTSGLQIGLLVTGHAAIAPESFIASITATGTEYTVMLTNPLAASLDAGTMLLAYASLSVPIAGSGGLSGLSGKKKIAVNPLLCGATMIAGTAGVLSTTLTVASVTTGVVRSGLSFVVNGTLITIQNCSVNSIAFISSVDTSGGTCTLNRATIINTGTTINARFTSDVSSSAPLGWSVMDDSSFTAYADAAGGTTINFRMSLYPIVNGMVVSGKDIPGAMTLSACGVSLSSASGQVHGNFSGSCTLASAVTLNQWSTVTLNTPGAAVFSSVARGTIVTAINLDMNVCTMTLSKPLTSNLALGRVLRLTKYGNFAVDDYFRTPLTGGVAGQIKAVSGPVLGIYTLTVADKRTFLPWDSLVSLVAGSAASLAEPTRATLSGYIYRVAFLGNPGKLRQPEIVTHLDGKRNSLASTNFVNGIELRYRVVTKVWTDGQQGENVDYIADHCDGVQATIGNSGVSTDGLSLGQVPVMETNSQASSSNQATANLNSAAKFFLGSLTFEEKQLLKKCLGGSDFDESNNRDVYNWDWGWDAATGTARYPHLIKLVRSITTYTDGGYYAALYYKESDSYDGIEGGTFFLLNPFNPPDSLSTDRWDIYTTKGVLALASDSAVAYFGFGSRTVYTVNADQTQSGTGSAAYDGDVSCTKNLQNEAKFKYINKASVRPSINTTPANRTVCVDKTDLITFLNPSEYSSAVNPPHFNLYRVEAAVKTNPQWSNSVRFGSEDTTPDSTYQMGKDMSAMTNQIKVDVATNWGVSLGSSSDASITGPGGLEQFKVFKFYPDVPASGQSSSTYEYVAPCSNRGTCNTQLGECLCFKGFIGEACTQQDALAI